MWIAGCSWSVTNIIGSLGFKPVQLAFLGSVHQDLVVEGLLNVVQSSIPRVDLGDCGSTIFDEVLMFCITFT
jgi:hypothetical protein